MTVECVTETIALEDALKLFEGSRAVVAGIIIEPFEIMGSRRKMK